MVTSPIERVVDGGFCVGCGGCAVVNSDSIKMERNRFAVPNPNLKSLSRETLESASRVCPFSGASRDEDVIASELYGQTCNHDPRVGRYLSLGVGRIVDDREIMFSSSGGLTTWILTELLEKGLIDGVLHLGSTISGSSSMFSFQVSHTQDEIRKKRKSQYYSADFSEALLSIRGNGKRYAFVGVPCFAKALRNICEVDESIRRQISFVIALVCGHMKSPAFAELLAWQLGIAPSKLSGVDFRVKEGTVRADDYNFAATAIGDTKRVVGRTRDLYGHNWGHAMLQLKACDYCDDVFGETADICLGDAWLDQFTTDPRGTNVLVVRHTVIKALLADGVKRASIFFKDIDLESLVASQSGNFRHRREGLAVRQHDDSRLDNWTPPKRRFVDFGNVSYYRRVIVRLRRRLGEASHLAFLEAKEADDLRVYFLRTRRLVGAMRIVYRLPIFISPKRLLGSLVHRIQRLNLLR